MEHTVDELGKVGKERGYDVDSSRTKPIECKDSMTIEGRIRNVAKTDGWNASIMKKIVNWIHK